MNGNKSKQSRSLSIRCWLALIKTWLQVRSMDIVFPYRLTKYPGELHDLVDRAFCGLFIWHLLTLNLYNTAPWRLDKRRNSACHLWKCDPYLHNGWTSKYLGVKRKQSVRGCGKQKSKMASKLPVSIVYIPCLTNPLMESGGVCYEYNGLSHLQWDYLWTLRF